MHIYLSNLIANQICCLTFFFKKIASYFLYITVSFNCLALKERCDLSKEKSDRFVPMVSMQPYFR